jgi:hypothetical protein
MFNKLFSILGLSEPTRNPTKFTVQSTHRSTQEIFAHEFDTQSELDAFLAGYKPTAYLNYIRTKVYACFGSKQRLIEVHNHLTGNPSFEFKRFEGIAASQRVQRSQLICSPALLSKPNPWPAYAGCVFQCPTGLIHISTTYV